MNFKSISTRIIFAFSIIVTVIVLNIGYNVYAVTQSNRATEQIVDEELQLLITDYELASTIAVRIAAARVIYYLAKKNTKIFIRITWNGQLTMRKTFSNFSFN